MLSEASILAFLTASITGAGLVLAVYALIIPLSKRVFGYRAEEIYEDLQELKQRISRTDTRISSDDVEELKKMLENIEEIHEFPTYLGWGAGITFFFYVLSAFVSVWWIVDYNRPTIETWLPWSFGLSNLLFLIIGILSIKDISQTMKREFEDLKAKIEETKSNAEQ